MVTRLGTLLVCVMCWSASAVAQEEDLPVAQTPPSFVPPPPPVSSSPAAELLFKRIESIDWTDRTFEDVLNWLREEGDGRVNVVARENHLGVEGIALDSLVTLQLNSTTVADVLNETLEQLSETGEARYRAIGNKLTISTRADFERKMYTKVYDVTDIMFRVPNFGQGAPQIDLQNTNRSGGGGAGGGGGQSVFSGGSQGQEQEESGEQAEQELEQRLTVLRGIIEQTIAPETWDLTGSPGQQQGGGGGGRGRIRVFNRSLIVTNTIEVHEQIAGLFSFTD